MSLGDGLSDKKRWVLKQLQLPKPVSEYSVGGSRFKTSRPAGGGCPDAPPAEVSQLVRDDPDDRQFKIVQ